jgi:hypothetical protein
MIIKRLSYNYIAKVQVRSLKTEMYFLMVVGLLYYTSRCVKMCKVLLVKNLLFCNHAFLPRLGLPICNIHLL